MLVIWQCSNHFIYRQLSIRDLLMARHESVPLVRQPNLEQIVNKGELLALQLSYSWKGRSIHEYTGPLYLSHSWFIIILFEWNSFRCSLILVLCIWFILRQTTNKIFLKLGVMIICFSLSYVWLGVTAFLIFLWITIVVLAHVQWTVMMQNVACLTCRV